MEYIPSTVHKGLILCLNRKASFFLAAPRTGSLAFDGLENRVLLLWQNVKWQKISICKFEEKCHLRRQLQKKITDWPVLKLHVCKAVSIEFT